MNTLRNPNNTVTERTGEIVKEGRVPAIATTGKDNIERLIRDANVAIHEVLAEVQETVSQCEAEVELNEEISVILEPNRTVFSVKRNFRFAKDRP